MVSRKNKNKPGGKKRRVEPKIHLLPDGLAVLGLAEPLIGRLGGGQYEGAIPQLIASASEGQGAFLNMLSNTPGNIYNGVKEHWQEAAVLLVGSVVAKKAGKYFGLNRIGGKKVRLA